MDQLIQNISQLFTYDPSSPIIFSSGLFLALFVGFTLVYYLLQGTYTPRIIFVTLFSYYFYYKSSGFYFLLLAVITVSDYLIARAMHRSRERQGDSGASNRKWLLVLSLLIDLGFLGYFKYANFFGATVASIVGGNFQPWDIFLPVGISFFTFQSMSYTIDVYRGNLRPLDRLLDYAFYVSFFPQLVAGPIVRARDFAPQIRKPLKITNEMIAMGVYFIVIGLFKKAIISDYISINFVDRVFENPLRYTGLENFFGIFGYTLQLYCDFSGYSDMAIGLALLLGFKFPRNFNAPFKSESISAFWRRWHISLSTWIRDYVYISLGGNRKGKLRTYVNLFITMLLCGLWHGANWNFILWGALHGIALSLHRLLHVQILHRDKNYRGHWALRIGGVIATFVFVMFSMLIFRNRDMGNTITMLHQVASNFHPEVFLQFLDGYKWVVLLMAFGFVSHFLPDRWESKIITTLSKCNIVVYALILTALIFMICQVKSSEIQPFIYFQF